MKEYIIRCNEDQLQLMRSAIELQMRVRIGQGWAITENLLDIIDPEYRPLKENYDSILDSILRKIACNPDGTLRHQQRWVERDMWCGIEDGLGIKTDSFPLSEYGIMKVECTGEGK